MTLDSPTECSRLQAHSEALISTSKFLGLSLLRYIGSKENLLPFIGSAVASYGFTEGIFCDLFAGTTAVGRYFKRQGFRVISNDLMTYSFVFGKAYLQNNAIPLFAGLDLPPSPPTLFDSELHRLEQVLNYLNALPPKQGFVWKNYSDEGTRDQKHTRMYFSSANALRIDAVRAQIEEWHEAGAVTELEFYILLASLLEAVPGVSNTTGTYAAFLKFWESRSYKTLTLAVPPLLFGALDHCVYQINATELVEGLDADILYLDPPYNSRQYATNYHLMETIARGDQPEIYGKSGLRPYQNERSAFCQTASALDALNQTVSRSQARLVLLSYNSNGIMPHNAVAETFYHACYN